MDDQPLDVRLQMTDNNRLTHPPILVDLDGSIHILLGPTHLQLRRLLTRLGSTALNHEEQCCWKVSVRAPSPQGTTRAVRSSAIPSNTVTRALGSPWHHCDKDHMVVLANAILQSRCPFCCLSTCAESIDQLSIGP